MSRSQYRKEQRRVRPLRYEAWRRQGGICFWCFKPLPFELVTGDHIRELSAGGRSTRDNVVAACKRCNEERSNPIGQGQQREHVKTWRRYMLSIGAPPQALAPFKGEQHTCSTS